MCTTDPSTHSSAEAVEALHGGPLGVPAVPEEEAWAIAMAWAQQLQSVHSGHERLRLKEEIMRVDPFSVVGNYAWVKIRVDTQEDAAVARAATLAWFWLSCCPGYSARENPRFWKRVFNELQREQPCDEFKYPPTFPVVTDAVRFFDASECVFPQIHLQYQNVAQCDAFFTSSTPEREQAKIELIRLQLEPYVMPSRARRTIPVRLESTSGIAVTNVSAVLSNPTARDPHFSLHSVLVQSPHPHQRSELELSMDAFEVQSVDDARCLLASSRTTPSDYISNCSDGFRFQTLRMSDDVASSDLISRICSALPYSTAVSTVQVVSLTKSDDAVGASTSESMTWAWLGYAIFHPETKHSSWRNLDVSADSITRDSVASLESMGKGINFVNAELKSQDYTSFSYHAVRICPGTVVRVSPNDEARDAHHLSDATYAYLCVDSSNRVFELNGWARIVLPIVGFGWVRSSAITGISSHPPGESWLRGLRVRGGKHFDSNAVLRLTEILGSRLERLDIGGCGAFSADQLRRLLLACPALKSLSVAHDSTMWTYPVQQQELSKFPRLEQLSLSLDGGDLHQPHQDMLNSVLQHLSALRVLTTYQTFSRNRSAVCAFVNSLRKLAYFHVCDPNERASTRFLSQVDDAYIKGRINTHKWLGNSFFENRQLDARVAFLSVVHARQTSNPSSAVARVHRDLSSHIFAFASGSLLRDVWVGECTEVS